MCCLEKEIRKGRVPARDAKSSDEGEEEGFGQSLGIPEGRTDRVLEVSIVEQDGTDSCPCPLDKLLL